MPLTQIAFGFVQMGNQTTLAPALIASSIVTQDLVPTEEAQETGIVAGASFAAPLCRIATDTSVHVSIGADPDAEDATRRILVMAGATEYFYVSPGDKVSVILAAEPEPEGEG